MKNLSDFLDFYYFFDFRREKMPLSLSRSSSEIWNEFFESIFSLDDDKLILRTFKISGKTTTRDAKLIQNVIHRLSIVYLSEKEERKREERIRDCSKKIPFHPVSLEHGTDFNASFDPACQKKLACPIFMNNSGCIGVRTGETN